MCITHRFSASIQNTLLKVLNDGPVEMHQYWTVDYLKLKANLEKSLKSHRTEISAMKEDSRYYIQKMVSTIHFPFFSPFGI